jgi:TrmH family RNA methyltransferase
VPILRSRDNPRVRRWAKLARDTRLRRTERRALLEGPHLVAALLDRGLRPEALIASESGLEQVEIRTLIERSGLVPVVLPDALFRATVDAANPPGIAAEIRAPEGSGFLEGECVFLEGVQDAGNVGAIIRSAAAFGVGAVVVDLACADPWSPKALRAGMGGHFGLQVIESSDLFGDIRKFEGRLLCTVPRDGVSLKHAPLGGRLGWLFGSEGQGISERLLSLGPARISIPTSPGTESLNVAAAAAICLFAAFSRPDAGS